MITYSEAKELFFNHVQAYSSEATLEFYETNMGIFEKYLAEKFEGQNWGDFELVRITKEDFIGYIAKCRSKGIKNTSVRTYARAIKVFFRWCYNEGYMYSNITYNVKFPKADDKQIMPLSEKRVSALYQAIECTEMSLRNKAIFSLMLDCGLRVSEVVSLNRSDIDEENDCIRIINTKNNKSRIVPLPVGVRRNIRAYLKTRTDTHAALFLDRNCYGRITKCAIQVFMNRLKKVDKEIHCHLLRHTFATSFIMGGGELEILRVLMGHDEYAVTKGYIHLASQLGVINYDVYKLDGIMFGRYIAYKPRVNRNFGA